MLEQIPLILPRVRRAATRRVLSWLFFLLPAGIGVAAAAGYEPEMPQFRAEQLLEAPLLKGPNHAIQEAVVNKGYMNQYRIETSFGVFPVSGDAYVAAAVHEIDAIVELRQMSKTGVVAKSASEAVQKPVETAKQFAENPEETIRGIPAGVGRLFSRAKDVGKDVAEKASEASAEGNGGEGSGDAMAEAGSDLARKYLGVSSAQRKLAEELQVDPYTTNEVLQTELADMAKYAAAGSVATKLVMPSIPGMGVISNVNDLVWTLSARDLKLRNQKSLAAMGVDDALVERFFDNPNYTPTDQTRIVAGLEALSGVSGRAIVVAKAAAAGTRDEALLFTRLVTMLTAYHQARAPIARIIQTERLLPLAATGTGTTVLAVPVDYINWRESTADAAVAFLKAGKGTDQGGEIWVEGSVSDRARRELGGLGWSIHEAAFTKLDKGQ